MGDRVDSHPPVAVRVRSGRDDWVDCEVAASAAEGPGGNWLVLSVREVAERDEVAERKAILRQLIHFASVEFARTRWYDVDEVTEHLLRSLCGVFGASLVEIAWSDEAEGPLTLEACWSMWAEDSWTPNRLCRPGSVFEEIHASEPPARSGAWSCADLQSLEPGVGTKQFIDAGLDSVVELRLSPDRPRAVLRMGFAGGLASWDEINTEPVSLLGLLVLSSLRRCRLEAALSERARRDSLTGVLNRDEFYQQLEVREGDLVARVGGDEFVALCRGLESPEQLESVKQRVADRLAEDQDADAVIGAADAAMYREKRRRRPPAAL